MDYESSNLSLGLAMANLLDDELGTGKRPLTEAEKEKMIFQYKDAENAEKKERIRNAIPEEDSGKDIFGGPSIG